MFPEFSLPTVAYGMAGLLPSGRVRCVGGANAAARDYNRYRCWGQRVGSEVCTLGGRRASNFDPVTEPPRWCRGLPEALEPEVTKREAIDDDKTQAGTTGPGGVGPWAGVHGDVRILWAVRRLRVDGHDPPRDRSRCHVSGHGRHLRPVQE